MPNYNFGMGFQSNPMDAYNETSGMVKQSRLAKLLGGYYQSGQADLGQIAQLDPQAAQAIQKEQQQRGIAKLLGDAYAAPEDQRGGMLRQLIAQDPSVGMQAAKMLDPRLSAGEKPSQQQYAEWLLSQAPADQRDQVLGVLAGYKARPSGAAIQYKKVIGADGVERMVAYDPQEVGAQVIGSGETYGSGVGGGMPSLPPPTQQPQIAPPPSMAGGQMFAGLGQIPGVQVTSGQRTPERNAKVGGVPNSFHLTNQARDILPPQTPAQAQQVRQFAAQNGLEIIDEGDHWHLEPRSRNAQPQRTGANPFQSRPQEQQKYLDEQAQQRAQIDALPVRGQIEASNAGLREYATQDAQLDALPRRGELEADNAGAREAAVTRARLAAERQGKRANESLDATDTLNLIDGAEELLKRATGGLAGSTLDKTLGAFNVTTEGAKATAGLKILSAKLVQKVPRFEGPQSNIDVQSYREAAGDLANDQLPVGQRLAALQTMRDLAKRAVKQAPPQPASGGWGIREIK